MKIVRVIRTAVAALLVCAVLIPFSIINTDYVVGRKYDVLGIGTLLYEGGALFENLQKRVFRKLNYLITGTSPTANLYIGKEGWIYYTPNSNVDIAKGKYLLTQQHLDDQASIFSNVKKYYDTMDADLYILPYPAKPAIYPEYIEGVSLPIGETPVDLITNNLRENTDVNVISVKKRLLEDKELGLLYLKTDVHMSDLGAYSTYKGICSEISAYSGLMLEPIEVSFAEGEYAVWANGMAGVDGLFGDVEIAPVAQFKANARRVTEGALYDAISDYTINCEHADDMTGWSMYENPGMDTGTLLIYGTSMFSMDDPNDEGWQLVRYLAENFSQVVYIGISSPIQPTLDALIQPDYVIVEIAERYSDTAPYSLASLVPTI